MTTPSTQTYPVFPERIPAALPSGAGYDTRFARSAGELEEVLRLRYEVFNLELNEGLDMSRVTGLDRDPYDAGCHHSMVIFQETNRVIGTYRMQTWEMARANLGWYSDNEFDLSMLPASIRDQALELGRACIAAAHRNGRALYLLWRDFLHYLRYNGKRYMIGCCSLSTQDPREGWRMWDHLQSLDLVHPTIRVEPRPAVALPPTGDDAGAPEIISIPTLMQLYLNYGARVCSPPAIDRDFKTIDFFVISDFEEIPMRRRRFLEQGWNA